jgi:hypothetical protein
VAFDGSTTGLSANGRTLVLTGLSNRYPVRRTELVFLDARRLQVRGRVTLPGWFTADAISPDGRSLYLIHYPSNGNILRYEVRAYDIPSQRLVRKPVIDPREPDEAMRGMPMARVVSADGRWAYTLYDRPQGRPFIHALDTTGRTARCLDLPYSATGSQSPVRLALVDGGRELRVRNDDGPLASVNLSTFKVSDLLSQRVVKTLAPRPAPATARHASSGVRWIIALVVVALGAAAALALAAGRRRRRPPHDVGISVEVR